MSASVLLKARSLLPRTTIPARCLQLSSCQNGKLTKEDHMKMLDARRIKPKNSHGPLINTPDWSYLDGRPAPPGARAVQRREIQKQICQRIIDLNRDIDKATKRVGRMKTLKRNAMQQRKNERF